MIIQFLRLIQLFHTFAEKSPRHTLHIIPVGPQQDGRDRAAYITYCRQALAAAQTGLELHRATELCDPIT
jgi:hypothetical protein